MLSRVDKQNYMSSFISSAIEPRGQGASTVNADYLKFLCKDVLGSVRALSSNLGTVDMYGCGYLITQSNQEVTASLKDIYAMLCLRYMTRLFGTLFTSSKLPATVSSLTRTPPVLKLLWALSAQYTDDSLKLKNHNSHNLEYWGAGWPTSLLSAGSLLKQFFVLCENPFEAMVRFRAFAMDSVEKAAKVCGALQSRSKVFESEHPYRDNMDQREKVVFPGAKSIRISFDPRCHLEVNCDIVFFYRDPAYENVIRQFDGIDAAAFPSFEIEGDTFYLRFRSDGSRNDWGYRFSATPVTGESENDPFSKWTESQLSSFVGRHCFFANFLYQSCLIYGSSEDVKKLFNVDDVLIFLQLIKYCHNTTSLLLTMHTIKRMLVTPECWSEEDISFLDTFTPLLKFVQQEVAAEAAVPNFATYSNLVLCGLEVIQAINNRAGNNPKLEIIREKSDSLLEFSKFLALVHQLCAVPVRRELGEVVLSYVQQQVSLPDAGSFQIAHLNPRTWDYDRLLVFFLNEHMHETHIDNVDGLIFDDELCVKWLIHLESRSAVLYEDQSFRDTFFAKGRFYVIKYFNQLFDTVFPFVDFVSLAKDPVMSGYRFLLFFPLKKKFFKKILDAAKPSNFSNTEYVVKFYRHRASKAAETPFPLCLIKTFLGQATKLLFNMPPMNAFITDIDSRPWKVEFHGEGTIDAGGPFRESVSMLCLDFMNSTACDLTEMTPNGRFNVGLNREKKVLKPSARHSIQLDMIELIGYLIGFSMRTQYTLDLDLASNHWKQLSGQPLSIEDLTGIDALTVQTMKDFDAIIPDAKDEDFPDLGHFVTQLSDGTEVELKENGKFIAVTPENCSEYSRLVIKARLEESSLQIEALKRGLGRVVPLELLQMFSGAELETMVCGRPEVDLELMKRHTTYEGVSSGDAHVQFMWRALESFSTEQRKKFLRFVWGRSRLPSSDEAFRQNFKVAGFSGNNRALPRAHTCFFQIDLPNYQSYESARQQILYAVENCTEMDGVDGTGDAGAFMAE